MYSPRKDKTGQIIPPSIYQRYFTQEPLNDRYLREPEEGIDVIIPVMHTNELWESNLHSIYREIPVVGFPPLMAVIPAAALTSASGF